MFFGIIEELIDLDYIRLEKYFVDGTKIEANANRYSFVWKKSTEKHKAGLQEKVKALKKDPKNKNLLRDLDKVKTEWGILAIAHNMAKAAVQ